MTRQLTEFVSQIRGKWVPDALAQLKFSPKHRAEDVAKIVRVSCAPINFAILNKQLLNSLAIVQRAASLAKLHHNAIPEELVVKEVTVTKGMTHKRSRIMGKGRTGTGYARWAHVRVKVEKVDFQREIREAVNPILQKRWIRLSKQAYHARKLLTVSQESTPGTTPRS